MLRVSNCIFRTRELDIIFHSFAPVLSFGNSNGWRILDRFNQANLESLCLFECGITWYGLSKNRKKQSVSIPSPVLLSFLVVDWCCRDQKQELTTSHELAHTHSAIFYILFLYVSMISIYICMLTAMRKSTCIHAGMILYYISILICGKSDRNSNHLVSLRWSHWICTSSLFQIPGWWSVPTGQHISGVRFTDLYFPSN